jgi:hypothetical protein
MIAAWEENATPGQAWHLAWYFFDFTPILALHFLEIWANLG